MGNRFTFFLSYYESLKELPPEDFKAVVCAMCAYAFDGEFSELTGMQKAIFALIRPNLEKSLELVERRKQAGKLGAEARARQMASKQVAKSSKTVANVSKQVANGQQVVSGVGVGEGVGVGKGKGNKEKGVGNNISPHNPPKGSYSGDAILDEAIGLFIEHRKKLKKPMTGHAVDLLVKRLMKLSDTTDGRVGMIDEAIRRGWLDVYPPKEPPKETGNRMDVVDRWLGGNND